jgi:alkyldihydroxyacetonephosphate synthase
MVSPRSLWAWGLEAQEPTHVQLQQAARGLSAKYKVNLGPVQPPKANTLELSAARVRPPLALAEFTSTGTRTRAFHTYGHSFRDRVRKFHGLYPSPVDAVASPRTEGELASVLDWCASKGYAALPFGGGSSVVGGFEPPDSVLGAISVDMSAMDRVLEVDTVSRAARIQAGAFGPAIESHLKPYGLTLRHFPQSFEFSTLGGWIATRSAGHYATNQTHIEDYVESIRMVTPSGVWASRRLPGSGAGPDPNRLAAGSEGIFGVITEAWVRVQASPRYRTSAGVEFPSFAMACEAARAIVQAKLWPANCRVLDEGEAQAAAGMDGSRALLVLGFESADAPQDGPMQVALEIAKEHGGSVGGGEKGNIGNQDAVAQWRKSFLEMPFVWNTLLGLGLINDTFETAVTWDRWPQFHENVRSATLDALRRVCGGGTVTCRITHIYPDGPAPYYTFTGLGKQGSELEMWAEIKAAASDAVVSAGGTITHHHAVGRDHRPWYDRERPGPFAEALRAAKKALDPKGVMNPGVLIEP